MKEGIVALMHKKMRKPLQFLEISHLNPFVRTQNSPKINHKIKFLK